MMKIAKSWHEVLKDEITKPYIQELKNFLENEKKANKIIYPPEPLVFNALAQTPYEAVKVVIVGQDPYHGQGQAHGLSFSVPPGITPPPSLKNIFKELESDLNIPMPQTGCLTPWTRQGVLLLNATLTVEKGKPKSHAGKGWELFTDAVVEVLAKRQDPIVFLLWGSLAQEKCDRFLENTPHLVLSAPHPSPYSAHYGFLGCKHFSKANAFLKQCKKEPIEWALK